MKKAISLFILLSLVCLTYAQENPDPLDPVIKALEDANAKSLATYFNVTIEMKVPDHEDTYSSSQGEMIMKDFFKRYPASSCTTVQKGNTDNTSRFAICDYFSGQTHFQVYLFLKKEQENFQVHKIKFEEKK